jgi:hypothetical protein
MPAIRSAGVSDVSKLKPPLLRSLPGHNFDSSRDSDPFEEFLVPVLLASLRTAGVPLLLLDLSISENLTLLGYSLLPALSAAVMGSARARRCTPPKKQLGKTPHRCNRRMRPKITALTTMTARHDELRDLHAARFAEISALREMLVTAGNGTHSAEIAVRMRDSVAEILRLQKIMADLDE